MPLSNSQYDSIMHEYDEQQNKDRDINAQRKDEVYSRIPEYKKLEDRLDSLHETTIARFLGGDKSALPELRKDSVNIQNEEDQLLKEHGFPSDYLDPVYKCPDCKDTGYIDNEKCHCFRQKEVQILYQRSNLETLLKTENFSKLSERYYTGSDLDNFRKIVQSCHEFVDGFDTEYHNICFTGSVGTGKSFLSCCIANDLISSGHSVLYFSAVRFFQLLTGASVNNKDSLSIVSLMDDLMKCDLLIIDDLGTENTTPFMISNLFSCINDRYNYKKPVIISTNLSMKEICDKYSDRILSRLTSYYDVYRLECQDIRIANKIDQKRT